MLAERTLPNSNSDSFNLSNYRQSQVNMPLGQKVIRQTRRSKSITTMKEAVLLSLALLTGWAMAGSCVVWYCYNIVTPGPDGLRVRIISAAASWLDGLSHQTRWDLQTRRNLSALSKTYLNVGHRVVR
jgi:hypothetical protein